MLRRVIHPLPASSGTCTYTHMRTPPHTLMQTIKNQIVLKNSAIETDCFKPPSVYAVCVSVHKIMSTQVVFPSFIHQGGLGGATILIIAGHHHHPPLLLHAIVYWSNQGFLGMSDHRVRTGGGGVGKYTVSLNHFVSERKVFRDDETELTCDSIIPSLSVPKGNENVSTQRLVPERVQQHYS